ncbi:unnamed protein product [Brassica napus]|nr:unnamed protein product [Brassica napus]
MPKAAAILELCVFKLTIEPELNYGGRLFPASLRYGKEVRRWLKKVKSTVVLVNNMKMLKPPAIDNVKKDWRLAINQA